MRQYKYSTAVVLTHACPVDRLWAARCVDEPVAEEGGCIGKLTQMKRETALYNFKPFPITSLQTARNYVANRYLCKVAYLQPHFHCFRISFLSAQTSKNRAYMILL